MTQSDGFSTSGDGTGSACAPPHLSPSLLWPGDTAASYELKFLLGHTVAEQVGAWARQHLVLDPHADAARGDAYHIRSIYFDTDELAVFHQRPTFKRRKFRLRRYGTERGVFLERKSKSAGRVRKRRTLISDSELGLLQESAANPEWSGHWFHRRVLARQLRPRCLLSYDRIAHVGSYDDGPFRLTLDRNIHCVLTSGFDFDASGAGLHLLTDKVILELKFRSSLPLILKRLIEEMDLNPGGVSKYRTGIQAWGLATTSKVG